jgi:hypothetical protein
LPEVEAHTFINSFLAHVLTNWLKRLNEAHEEETLIVRASGGLQEKLAKW